MQSFAVPDSCLCIKGYKRAPRALQPVQRRCLGVVQCSLGKHQQRPNANHGHATLLEGFKSMLAAPLENFSKTSLGLAAALLISFSSPASAEKLTFPVAEDPNLFGVQKTLVEAWTIITESYVDPNFNQVAWPEELSDRLTNIADSHTPNEARMEIKTMVSKLGDPFTRWVPPEEYAKFRISSDGELQGVGLLIASDPSSGRLVVLAPLKGSPADRAGIQPGDQVVAVDGASTEGWDGEEAAKYLRGQQGSSVTVEVARRKGDKRVEMPGVAGLRLLEPELEYKRFRLQRERVELSPVFATAVHYDDHAFGYVRLVNFSAHASDEMLHAVTQLKKDGVEAFILDLRNNPGGLVHSSLEIAGMWMDPASHPTVFQVQDRSDDGAPQKVVLGGRAGAVSDLPLVVLVNKQSASASEILAGALRDNGRAQIIGDHTFGKGKIQSVFELADGSAVFVTVAKYTTPHGTPIDQIGIIPDKSCSLKSPGGPASVPGIPVGIGADEQVIEELASDECVLTAEALLQTVAESKAPRA